MEDRERKIEEMGQKHEQEATRLRQKRRELEHETKIAGRKAPTPPSPDAKFRAPPTNLYETHPKNARLPQGDESSAIAGEEEEHGRLQPGSIDITKPENANGPHIRAE